MFGDGQQESKHEVDGVLSTRPHAASQPSALLGPPCVGSSAWVMEMPDGGSCAPTQIDVGLGWGGGDVLWERPGESHRLTFL